MVVTQGLCILLVIIGLVEDKFCVNCLKTKSDGNVFDRWKCTYDGFVDSLKSPSKMDNTPFACGYPEGVQRRAEEAFKPIEIKYGKSQGQPERSKSRSSKSRFGLGGFFKRMPKFNNYPRKTGVEKGISIVGMEPYGSNKIPKKLIDIESLGNFGNIASIGSVGSGASNDLPDSYEKIMGFLFSNGKPRISPGFTKTSRFDSQDKSAESNQIKDIPFQNPRLGIGNIKSRIQTIPGNIKSAGFKSPISVTGVSSSDNLCSDNPKISCGNNEKPEVTESTGFHQNTQSDESGKSDELQNNSITKPGFGIGKLKSRIQKILGKAKSARSKSQNIQSNESKKSDGLQDSSITKPRLGIGKIKSRIPKILGKAKSAGFKSQNIQSNESKKSDELQDSSITKPRFGIRKIKSKIQKNLGKAKSAGFKSQNIQSNESEKSDELQDSSITKPRFRMGYIKSRIPKILGKNKSAGFKPTISVVGASFSGNLCSHNPEIPCDHNKEPKISKEADVSQSLPSHKSEELDKLQGNSFENPSFVVAEEKPTISTNPGFYKTARLDSQDSVEEASSSEKLCSENSEIPCANNKEPKIPEESHFSQSIPSHKSGELDGLQESSDKNPLLYSPPGKT